MDASAPGPELYRDLFDNVGVALFVHDPAVPGLVFANPAARKLYGLDDAALTSGWPRMLLDERQIGVDPEEALERAQRGAPVDVEWPARRADGSPFWVALGMRRAVLGGQPYVLIEAHDVSVRRSAVRALADSERELESTNRMLRSVLAQIPTRVFWKDRDLRYLGCNDAFARVAGLEDTRDVIGLTDEDLPWCAQAPLYHEVEREVIETSRRILRREEPRTRVDGTRAWLRTTRAPLLDAQGHVIGVLGVSEDISAQKAYESALREREEDLRITLDSIRDGVIATDDLGRVRRMNPVAERLTGWLEADAVGRPLGDVYQLLDHETGRAITGLVERARTGGTVDLMQSLLLRSKDGKERSIVDSVAEIRDGVDEARGVVIAFRDVSEARALQAQLDQARRIEAVGLLAGGVAHDFNNLLQVILGYVNLVLEDLPRDDPNAESLEDVVEAAERAATLTQQLLAFSGRAPSRPFALDVTSVVRALEPLMRRVLGDGLELELELEPDLPQVHADRQQVELAASSLVLHARSMMREGGRVTVRTTLAELDEAQAAPVPGARAGRFVVLSVADRGPGLPVEDRARLFEPFHAVSPEGQGTGLGLASVDAVAQLHGGFVLVQDRDGGGMRFDLFLPALDERASGPPELVEDSRRPGAIRVLVAEDVDSVRALAVRVLRRGGYQVVEAKDGVEAEERFLEDPAGFGAALLDVVMPRRGGLQVYRTIKAQRPDLPVLFVSAYAGTVLAPGPEAPEMAHVLQKPYRPETLLAKLGELAGPG